MVEQRQLGGAGVRVSELGLGTMTFGRECDEATSRSILDRFIDAGGTFVDTANNYGEPGGESEAILGRALAGRRDTVVLATKVRFFTGDGANDRGLSRRHVRMSVDASLRRLQTDWIDLLQVHSWDPVTPLDETLSTLDDLVRAGKVRYIGASNFTGWQLATANGLAAQHAWEPFVSYQGNYSLVGRELEREVLPYCTYAGLGMLPYGPLGGGLLTGKYRRGETPADDTRAAGVGLIAEGMSRRMTDRAFATADVVREIATELGRTPAQVALNWVTNRPEVTSSLIGARTVDQLDDNLGSVGWQLSPADVDRLDEASRISIGYPQEFQHWMASIAM
jgi:aryl-alcohol dehydrogenase-like predicted oxidoreductase